MKYVWSHSWYRPGTWKLPRWWTEGPPVRDGRATHEEQEYFYNSDFVRNVLGHEGGMTTLPNVNSDIVNAPE